MLHAPRQTTSKTGTQLYPLVDRLPNVTPSSQTPRNIALGQTLPLERQEPASPTRTQELVPLLQPRSLKVQPHTLGVDSTGITTTLQPLERRPQTQFIKQNEKTEKHAADEGAW